MRKTAIIIVGKIKYNFSGGTKMDKETKNQEHTNNNEYRDCIACNCMHYDPEEGCVNGVNGYMHMCPITYWDMYE